MTTVNRDLRFNSFQEISRFIQSVLNKKDDEVKKEVVVNVDSKYYKLGQKIARDAFRDVEEQMKRDGIL